MNLIKGKELLDSWNKAKFAGATQPEHAKELGIPYSTYKSRMYRAQADAVVVAPPEFKGYDRPELYDWSLPEKWEFTWDDFMVIGDVQLPTTNYDFATLPALIAGKHIKGRRRLIIGGDFYNMDAYSEYKKIVPLPTFREEQEAARNLLALYATVFEEIYMICGNHERRRLARLEGEEDIQDVITAAFPGGHVKATVNDMCTVNTIKGKYTVIHGANYSKKALAVADELAQKHQSHIISHHEHHAAIGMDRFDRYFIVNNGGLFDQKKMAYTQIVSNTMANMSNGFTMVKGGYPYLFGNWTNWSEWL